MGSSSTGAGAYSSSGGFSSSLGSSFLASFLAGLAGFLPFTGSSLGGSSSTGGSSCLGSSTTGAVTFNKGVTFLS